MEKKLEELDDTLAMTKNQYTGDWLIWAKKESLRTKVCWGWMLLFTVHPADLGDGSAVLARLYSASMKRWGSGKAYFDAITREMERDKEARERASSQDTMDRAMDVFNYSQVKNIGQGNKFQRYHQ